MDWSENEAKLFRWLLHVYPAEFRREYASEMEQLFADRRRTEPGWRLWLDSIADVALSAPKEHWNILLSDLRYGLRILRAAPFFTSIALVVMALGIGSTTAIFSLVDAVLLRSLPYDHPKQLVYLWEPNTQFRGANVPNELGPSVPDYYDWERLSKSFSSITMLRVREVNLRQDGAVSRTSVAFVSPSFFGTFGVSPSIGRSFTGDDQRVVVVSDAYSKAHFGSSTGAIGRELTLDRKPYRVIGVMPKDFGYPLNGDIPYTGSLSQQTDLWLPYVLTSAEKNTRGDTFVSSDAAIGRLRPGVSVAAAEAELRAIEARLDPLYPKQWRGWTAYVTPLVETIVGPVEKMMWLLLGAVGIVLLIAISNVANLLLARVAARAHELGIRTALGAERARLVRQLLTESLLLSCLGGTLGVALAYALVHLLGHLNPGNIPRFDSAAVDGRVLLVAVILSVLSGLLCGIAPTIAASRFSVSQLLRQGGTRGVAGTRSRGRHSLIVVEVALSVVLLAGAGLLIRSYLQLEAVNPGFSPSTLTFQLTLDDHYSRPEQQTAFYKRFLARLQTMPGVTSAGAANETPIGGGESVSFAQVKGFAASKELVEGRSITPDYARALAMPILAGRNFTEHDLRSRPPVAIVNESFVKAYFHGRNPIGQQMRSGMGDFAGSPWATVVGVMGDVRQTKLEEAAQPQMFFPADSGNNFAIKSSLPTRQVMAEARAALHSLDPSLTLETIRTMRQRINESNARRRFQTTLLTGFAALAVALALVGLYGLMSYAVKQRTAEIGVRLAVGSSRAAILRLILSQGLRLTVLGLAIGLAGAFALTRLVSNWLFGVSATDPVTFLAVPLFILLVGTSACLLPAWGATLVDPVVALRQE